MIIYIKFMEMISGIFINFNLLEETSNIVGYKNKTYSKKILTY